MADIVERTRTLRWRLLVALALLAVVMLAPNGLLASWTTANGWVLAAVLAVLAVLAAAGAVIGVAIVMGAALDD